MSKPPCRGKINKMTPKLSIITVNFNNKDGLIRTAESVVAQTWGDYEWIIIDGGSTDGSVGVIREYIDKSTKLAYWCSEKDGGVYSGMNKGIAKASGEYCYFLNSGDYLREPASLERVFAVDFDEDIVYGDMMLEREGGRCVARKFKDNIRPSGLLYGILPHQNMLIKTKILTATNGYRTDLKIVSDWAHYTAAICRDHVSYRHVPLVLAINQGGGMSNDAKCWHIQKAERKAVIKEIFPAWKRAIYFFTMASLKSKIDKIRYRLEKYRIIGG